MTKNSVNSRPYDRVAILGAGSWGQALAQVARAAGREVTLYGRGEDSCAAADALFVVVPAQEVRAAMTRLAPSLADGTPVVLCAKGIERATGMLLNEVLAQAAPRCEPAILSGPSFAGDVIRGLPTAVTIAARPPIGERLQVTLGSMNFRPYASDDIVGVALGGAAKNVYAIACGIVDGLGLGESARAALLARGFAELGRLGEALGARRETLMGLSGLGDLVLTATSATSRNFTFGRALGRGQSLASLQGGPLAEGAATAPALVSRAAAHKIELPIAQAVADILTGGLTLADALPRLTGRPLRTE